nr:hypothetical protein [Tanacetum cinerariifolium]
MQDVVYKDFNTTPPGIPTPRPRPTSQPKPTLLPKSTPPPRDHPPRLTGPTVTMKPKSCCRHRCLAENVVVAAPGTPEMLMLPETLLYPSLAAATVLLDITAASSQKPHH